MNRVKFKYILQVLSLTLLTSCLSGPADIEVKIHSFGAIQGGPPEIFHNCTINAIEDSSYTCIPIGEDPDGEAISWSLKSSTCPWISLNSSTGELSGTPTNSHVGSCRAVIVASDGKTNSNDLIVDINVQNTSPILSLSNTSIPTLAPLITLKADADVQATDENQGGIYSLLPATTTSPKCSDNGLLAIHATNGEITFDVDNAFTGTCYVKVSFDDGNLGVIESEFSVDVIFTPNSAPVVSSTCATSIVQNSNYTCSASLVDSNPYDTHTWAFTPSNTCSWLTINLLGEISGTPDNSDVGTCTLEFYANDGTDDSNIQTYNISVDNLAPTFTIADTTINEDAPSAVIRTDAQVQSIDEGFGVYSLDNTTGSTPRCSDNGTLSIDANNGEITFEPTANYSGDCYIKVQFDDGNASNNIATAQFILTVTEINDIPVMANQCALATSSCGSNMIGTVSGATGILEQFATTPDLQNMTLCFVPNPSNGYDIFAQTGTSYPRTSTSGHSTLILGDDNNSNINLSTPFNYYGNPVSSIYVVSNGYLSTSNIYDYNTSLAAFQANTRIAPFWRDLNPTSQGQVTYFDDATKFIVTYNNVPTFGTTNSNNAQIDINKATGEIIINYGVIQAADAYVGLSPGVASTQLFDYTNGAGSGGGGSAIAQDETFNCTPSISDVEGQTITWQFDSTHTCTWMSINSSTGEITGTPNDDQLADCTLAYFATDGTDSTPIETLDITLLNVTPTLAISDTSINEDAPLTVIKNDAQVQASDEGYGLYSFDHAFASSPSCSTKGTIAIDSLTGAISYTPEPNFSGVCYVNVVFDDGNASGNLVSSEFSVTVNAVNDAPVIASSCPTTINQGANFSCSLTLTDPDLSDTHAWTKLGTSTCSWASVNASTGEITGTPTDDDVGTCLLEVKTNDGTSDSNTLAINYTINNGAPILTIADAFLYQDSAATEIRTDADVQANDEPSGLYSIIASTTSPDCSAHGSTSIDTATGAVTYTPAASYVGECYINVQFDDQHATNNLGSAEFKVTVMDNAGATIIGVDSLGGDRTYLYGETVDIDITFNETVFVDTTGGIPKIRLETGAVDRFAYYTSGSGSDTLTFQYQIGLGDESLDLDIHNSYNSIELSGGTILDNFNNTSALAAPVGITSGSLFNNRNIIINTTINFAEFSGQPTRVSADIVLDVDVYGAGLNEYKYKLGEYTSTDCSDSTGYSAAIAIATNITDSISSYAYGTKLRLCMVGKNTVNNWQPYDLATIYEWTRDKYAITDLSFEGITNIPSFYDAAVAPNNNNIIYARNLENQILYSNDKGATWRVNCTIPNSSLTTGSRIYISGEADATAYVAAIGEVYRADYNLGGNCTHITSSINNVVSNYLATSFSTSNTTSDIFASVIGDGSQGMKFYKSIDRGDSWTLLYEDSTNQSQFSTLLVDPNDQQTMYVYRYGTDGVPTGIHQTTDGGLTWNLIFTHSGANNVYNMPLSLVANPSNSNALYQVFDTNGVESYSLDKGVTWTSSSAELRNERWQILGDSTAIRLNPIGYDTQLLVAPSFSTPSAASWSVKYTFPNARGGANYSQSISASTDGQTFAAIIENKLFVSSDAALTFNEINWQGNKLAVLSGISSEDGGQNIYGITPNWAVVKSTNAGEDWIYKTYFHYACNGSSIYKPRIRTSPASSENVFAWADGLLLTSNYCSASIYSTSGMDTSTNNFNGLSANQTLLAMSPTNENKYFLFGSNGTQKVTADGGLTWTQKATASYTSFAADAYTSSNVSDLVYMITTPFNGELYEVNTVTDIRTNITSRTGLSSIAGMNTVKADGGTFKMRLISAPGQVVQSTDDGQTFSLIGTTTGQTSCSNRFLTTYFKDHNIMATACQNDNRVAFTRNEGADWIQMDLNTLYGINCSIRGIALHPSRIFIACANSQAIMINYTPLELINDIVDGVLSSYEGSSTQELIRNVNDAAYVSIEYALIPDGTICNQDITTFSSTIPLANDPTISADGVYRVCAKMTDENNVIFYETSSSFIVDKTVPAFNSIDLANEASDGILKFEEHYNNINPVVENLNATGFDLIGYAIVSSATTCDSSLNYVQSTPQANDYHFDDSGNYKVCVKLSDYAGHPDAYGESSLITYSSTLIKAIINGAPEIVTKDTTTNITITATGATKYRYLFGESANVNCNDKNSYGPEIAIGLPIVESLTSLPSNIALKLCVIASNTTDDWQPALLNSFYEFRIADKSIDHFKVNGNTLGQWAAVDMAKSNSDVLYALTNWGDAYKSTDFGNTWVLQCRVQTSLNAKLRFPHIITSKGADITSYAIANGDIFRIEDLNGYQCPNLTSGISYIDHDSKKSVADIDNNGNLYFFETISLGVTLWKATAKGNVLEFVSNLVSTNASNINLTIDPNNPLIMYSIQSGNSAINKGLYKSTDGGLNWTLISTTFSNTGNNQISVLPDNSDYLFADNNYHSTNGGTTWNYRSDFDNKRFTLEGSIGYRFANDSTNTKDVLQVSSSLTSTPTWTLLYTFEAKTIDNYARAVVTNGNKIAVIHGGDIYLSSDSGATFNKSFTNDTTKLSIWTFDEAMKGQHIRATVHDYKIIGSDDFGGSWSFKGKVYPSTPSVSNHHLYPVIIMDQIQPLKSIIFFNNYNENVNITSNTFWTTDDYATQGFIYSFAGSQNMSLTTSITKSGHYMAQRMNNSIIAKFEEYRFFSGTGSNFSAPSGYNYNYSRTQNAISPVNENLLYFVNTNQVYNYKFRHNNFTLLPAATPFTDFSGIEAFKNNDGNYGLRLFSNEGKIAESFNEGQSWSLITTTIENPYSCVYRRIKTSSKDSNFITTFCPNTNKVHYSKDAGVNFKEINLSSYGQDCEIGSVIYSQNNLLIGCAKNYALKIDLSEKVFLSGAASDGYLDATESASSTDLVSNNNNSNYTTSVEYAIVSSATMCDVSLTYSTTTPKSDDPLLSSDGSYKVCIKVTDNNAVVSYSETAFIHIQNSTPTFTSIALINNASDGLINFQEKLDDYSPIVDLPIGTNFHTSYYQVADVADTCSTLTDYSIQRPNSYNDVLHNTGTFKVCVKLENRNGNVTYGESSSFNYNGQELTAVLSNLPDIQTNVASLSINVSGAGITQYRYKLTQSNYNLCSAENNYSAAFPIATPISQVIPSTGSWSLCVIGGDATGLYQPLLKATKHNFSYGQIIQRPYSFGAIAAPSWKSIYVSRHNESTLYGALINGDIVKSSDAGSTWNTLCKIPEFSTFTTFHESPAIDEKIYFVTGSQAYRIDNNNGFTCNNITSLIGGYVDSNYRISGFTVASDGKLYASSNNRFYRSDNFGSDWKTQSFHNFEGSGANDLVADPIDNNTIYFLREDSIVTSDGFYKSSDALKTWTKVSMPNNVYAKLNVLTNDSNIMFTTNGAFSSDNGNTWQTISVVSTSEEYDISNSGDIYKFTNLGYQTKIIKNSSVATTPTTFADLTVIDKHTQFDSSKKISVHGNTVAAIANNTLFLSTDSGVTFNEVTIPFNNYELTSLDKVGPTIMGTSKGSQIFKSTDAGSSWEVKALGRALREYPIVRMSPANPDYAFVSAGETYTTYENDYYFTHDGFTSFATRSHSLYGGSFRMTISPTNQNQVGFIGLGKLKLSIDGGDTLTDYILSTPTTFSGSRQAWFSSSDDDYLQYVENSTLYEYRISTQTKTNINSRLSSITSPKGLFYYNNGGQWENYVIDQYGKTDRSIDDGITYNELAPQIYGQTACQTRLLAIASDDPSVILKGCMDGNSLFYSTDGGVNWFFYLIQGCNQPRDMILLNDGPSYKAIIACTGKPAIEMKF